VSLTTDELSVMKRYVREVLHTRKNIPVKIFPDDRPPELLGQEGYYTNRGGTVVQKPYNYDPRKGYLKYHHSNIRIEVGLNWVEEALNNYGNEEKDKQKTRCIRIPESCPEGMGNLA